MPSSSEVTAAPAGMLRSTFFNKHLPTANGKPRQSRTEHRIARLYGIVIYRIGNDCYVDEAEALRRLPFAVADRAPRRGRPPKVRAEASP